MSKKTKYCEIIPAQMERVTLERGWFITAWRVVDTRDKDILQPWFKTESEAKRVAKELGWTVV